MISERLKAGRLKAGLTQVQAAQKFHGVIKNAVRRVAVIVNLDGIRVRELAGELDFALELAEQAGIKLGVEPEPGNVIRDARTAERLLMEVDSPHLGIVLDAANLLRAASLAQQDYVMEEAVGLLGEKVLLAHAKDIASDGSIVAAGAGAVHLGVFVKLLRSAGFDGALVGHGFGPEEGLFVSTTLAALLQEHA